VTIPRNHPITLLVYLAYDAARRIGQRKPKNGITFGYQPAIAP
jgi:hypothetical protein